MAVSRNLLRLAAVISTGVHAFRYHLGSLPNGDYYNALNGGVALGHVNSVLGGGARNQFGMDYQSQGFTWTPALCAMDSDGDGVSNGAELGDPNCTWTQGQAVACTSPSHPGDAGAGQNVPCGGAVVELELPPGYKDPVATLRMHGYLMALSWGLFASVGVSTAFLEGPHFHGSHSAFQLHWWCMSLAYLTACVGVWYSYDLLQDVPGAGIVPQSTHGKIGIVVMLMAALQFPLAWVRGEKPAKDQTGSLARQLHKWNGRLLYPTAVYLTFHGPMVALGRYTDETSTSLLVSVACVVLGLGVGVALHLRRGGSTAVANVAVELSQGASEEEESKDSVDSDAEGTAPARKRGGNVVYPS